MLKIYFVKSDDKCFHFMENQVNLQRIEHIFYDTK